ncbi:metal-dependent hydrolase [Nostoc sp.]|uniref:metal-dependent hydrolase n=1 Tax=Nostoc sp. TaxID=1180 RepID=UPI0035944FBE
MKLKIALAVVVLTMSQGAWCNVLARESTNSTQKTTLMAQVTTRNAPETKIKWYGHAAFTITTPRGKVLMIDPWLKNPMNPEAKNGKEPLASIQKVDYILITHGHFDHVGDAVELAKKTGARLVTNLELGTNMAKVLGYPKQQMGLDTLMNIGGEIVIADGEVTVAMTPAIHSSSILNPNAGPNDPELIYGGNPAGFVLMIKNGPTIYHTGDTAYYRDMELIGERYAPDLALINIGGHFGMEPEMAAKAAVSVKAKLAIPQHFATFPVITQEPKTFANALEKEGVAYQLMQPGETISYKGRQLVEAK